MFNQNIILLIEQRKEIEKRIAMAKEEFEKSIAVDKALLEDIETEEQKMRNEMLLEMKQNNLDTAQIGNHLITRNVRITNQIADINKLNDAVNRNKDKIIALGVKENDLATLFAEELVIKNKKVLTEIVNNFEKIENVLLDGCEKRITEFLTVN